MTASSTEGLGGGSLDATLRWMEIRTVDEAGWNIGCLRQVNVLSRWSSVSSPFCLNFLPELEHSGHTHCECASSGCCVKRSGRAPAQKRPTHYLPRLSPERKSRPIRAHESSESRRVCTAAPVERKELPAALGCKTVPSRDGVIRL